MGRDAACRVSCFRRGTAAACGETVRRVSTMLLSFSLKFLRSCHHVRGFKRPHCRRLRSRQQALHRVGYRPRTARGRREPRHHLPERTSGAGGQRPDPVAPRRRRIHVRPLKRRYRKLHVLVHSVAYAPAEELRADFVQTTREGFRIAHDVSVYSLIAVARAAAPLMEDGGSIITMTYYGAEKVVPHYNVMAVAKAALECSVRYLAFDLGKRKIRVNAISAGPINSLSAGRISGDSYMLTAHAAP